MRTASAATAAAATKSPAASWLNITGKQQISPLGALALGLEEPLSPSEPSGRRADLAAEREVHADPRRAANRAESLAVREEPLVCALEPCDRLVVATEHEGAGRDQLEIRRVERRVLVRAHQQVMGLEPGPASVGLAALLELVDSLPRLAVHWFGNLSARPRRTGSRACAVLSRDPSCHWATNQPPCVDGP